MKETLYVRGISEALDEEMERDDNVLIIGEDIGPGAGVFGETKGLLKKYGPKRVKQTPISESAFMGLAIGAATAGLRPVVDLIFMDFLTVCMDPIVNYAAKTHHMFNGQYKVPMVIMIAAGAGLGAGPQHSQCLEAWFAHTPGLKVVMPSVPADVKGLMKAAIRDDNPVVYIYNKTLIARRGEVPDDCFVPLGKADIKREGGDVSIIAAGSMVYDALSAAETLAGDGISAEVVDLRTISPLDKETILASVKKTGRAVIVHEAVKDFGIGAEISAVIAEEAFDYLDAPIRRVAAPFAVLSAARNLEKAYLPSAEDIVQAVKSTMA